jgi:iron(III) transport system substrate-binding protein
MKISALSVRAILAALALVAATLASPPARAQGNLVLYCANVEDWCRVMVTAFERKTGIKVAMARKSSGEVYAQLKAEAANPRADLWWGGTGDPHMQAAEEGLTQDYASPNLALLHPWAVKQWEQSKHRAVGIFAGAMGFGFNTKQLAERKIAEPKCWADLLDPKLKDEVQVADPNSAGTAYNMLATIVQLMGEDGGFEYLKKLHRNVNQYTKSGAAPAKALSLGETTVGINFQHDIVPYVLQGAPIRIVSPCEGTGYEIGSMSIIRGARNPREAQAWYDWALTTEAQEAGPQSKTSFQVPANREAKVHPEAPDFSRIKFIDYDFAKYGSSEVRRRLLARWDAEVKNLPK